MSEANGIIFFYFIYNFVIKGIIFSLILESWDGTKHIKTFKYNINLLWYIKNKGGCIVIKIITIGCNGKNS